MKSRSWTQRYVLWMVFPFGRPQGCYLVPTLRWLKHLLLLLYCFFNLFEQRYRRQHLQNLSETLQCFQAKNCWRKIIGELEKNKIERENKPKVFQKQPPYSLVQPWSGIVADGLVYLSSDIFSYSVVHWLQLFHRGHS